MQTVSQFTGDVGITDLAKMHQHAEALEREINNLRAGLLLAAQWGIISDGWDSTLASELRAWIIDDMRKPAPTLPDYYPTHKVRHSLPPKKL